MNRNMFTELFSAFYRSAAEDELFMMCGGKKTGAYERLSEKASKLSDEKGFCSFLKLASEDPEVLASFRQAVTEAYQKVKAELDRHDDSRKKEIANLAIRPETKRHYEVQVLSSLLLVPPETFSEDNERLDDDGSDLLLEELIGAVNTDSWMVRSVAHILEGYVNKEAGIHVGDYVETVRMAGFDDAGKFGAAYMYGGTAEDLPLGSKGFITGISGDSKVNVRFDSIDRWTLSPDEIKVKKGNRIAEYIGKKSVDEAAAEIVSDAEKKGFEKARDELTARINDGYERDLKYHLDTFARNHHVSEDDVGLLRAGKTPKIGEGQFAEGEKRMKTLVGRLRDYSLASLDFRKKGTLRFDIGEGCSEQEFIKAFSKRYAELKMSEKEAKKVISSLTKAFESSRELEEFRLNSELARNLPPFSATATSLTQVLARPITLLRRTLYNDTDLYFAEPFAPPSESLDHVIVFQAQYGCDWNKCTYCAGYKTDKLLTRDAKQFREHVEKVVGRLGAQRDYFVRAFIDGGNILGVPFEDLRAFLKVIDEYFPNLRRVAGYTRAQGILSKTENQLSSLRDKNLRVVYWGIESGSDDVLKYVNKGVRIKQAYEAADRIKNTGIDVSMMVMPGIGGMKFYEKHAVETANIINHVRPRYLTFLSITPVPGTVYEKKMLEEAKAKANMPLSRAEVAEQIFDIVAHMNDDYRCLIASHMPPDDKVGSNPVQFRANFPGEKKYIQEAIVYAFKQGTYEPSRQIPSGKFNKDSALRKMLK